MTYGDSDEDGFGVGEGTSLCIGEQLAAELAINSTDCDDSNSNVFESLHYQAIDMDLDGYQLPSAGIECSNGTLSDIYQASFKSSKAPDCDDEDNLSWHLVGLYQDNDDDTKGAGDEVEHCVGATYPALWVNNSSDCEDSNSAIWREELIYTDAGADSYGDEASSALTCIGNLPPAGQVFDSSDCDDSNVNAWRIDQAYWDIDGDGFGAGDKLGHCTNTQAAVDTSTIGTDCDDDDVSVFRNIVIYPDTDGDGIGAGQGAITCMGNSYLEGNVSIYGYDPEPDNARVSNFDLSPAILSVQ